MVGAAISQLSAQGVNVANLYPIIEIENERFTPIKKN